jgi:hypothetical protein
MTYAITNDFSHQSVDQDVPACHAKFVMHQHSRKSLYTQHVEWILCMCSTIQTVKKVFFLEYHSHLR